MVNKFWLLVIGFLILTFGSLASHAQGINERQYTLGAGDVIQIVVFGQEDLIVETRLSNTGTISYPFLGDIKLTDLTISEAEQMIDSGLRGDFLVNPSVSVSVIEYRPFFIDGEIKQPGGYPYQPGLTVNKAAALAGGFTERAAKNKITIVRMLDNKEVSFEATSAELVLPGDILTIQQRFF